MVTGVGGRAPRQSLEGISLIQYPIPILMGWVVMVMGVEGWVTNAIPLRHFPNIIHNSNTWGWVVGSLAGSSCDIDP